MKLVLERFTHNALALLAVTTILFFMFRLMPGTPLAAFINENLNLEELAQDRAYEFAWSFNPLPVKGGTGSPGNSVAIA